MALGGRALRGHSNEPLPPAERHPGDWPQPRAAEHHPGVKPMLRQGGGTHRDATSYPCPAAGSPGTAEYPQRLRHGSPPLPPRLPRPCPSPPLLAEKRAGVEPFPGGHRHTSQCSAAGTLIIQSLRAAAVTAQSVGRKTRRHQAEDRGWPRGSCSPAGQRAGLPPPRLSETAPLRAPPRRAALGSRGPLVWEAPRGPRSAWPPGRQ